MENLTKLYTRIDNTMRLCQSSCKSGCDHCCYYEKSILPQEGKNLVDLIKSGRVKINEALLKYQATNPVKEQVYSQRRCVFLGLDNRCKIYSVRPMVCRKHIVSSDPKDCSISSKEGTKPIKNTKVEKAVNSLLHKYNSVEMNKYLYENL